MTDVHDWKCTTEEKHYRSIIDRKRVLKFFMDLHSSLDNVSGRFLSTKPLPSLRYVLGCTSGGKKAQGYACLLAEHLYLL